MTGAPLDLGYLFTRQSDPATLPVQVNNPSPLGAIGNTIGDAFSSIQQRGLSNAQMRVAQQAAIDAETERAARQHLGELIAGHFAVTPGQQDTQLMSQGVGFHGGETAQGPLPGQTTQIDPVYDPNSVSASDRLGAERSIARDRTTPSFIADAVGQAVQANARGGGDDLGNMLALIATGARDADSAVGFRGTPLSPGQSAFETGAHEVNAFNEEQQTARNDADNATSRANSQTTAGAQIQAANINAAVDRERIASTDRASRDALEISRSQRLNQQTIQAAVNNALHIRRGEAVQMPPSFIPRITAKVTQLLEQNPSLDPTTAASIAMDQMVTEEPANRNQPHMPFTGHDRRFNWTDEGEAFHPQVPGAPQTQSSTSGPATPATTAAPSPAAASVPAGSRVDDVTGIVYNAQGQPIGRVRRAG